MRRAYPDSEYRPRAMAVDFFRGMIGQIRKTTESTELVQREMAQRASLMLAVGVLSAPAEEQESLATAFGLLKETQPETALVAYDTLKATSILPTRELRRLLGLSLEGFIVPR